MDNLLITSANMGTNNKVEDQIQHVFKLKGLGAARYIMGVGLHHDHAENRLFFRQTRCIDDLVQRCNQTDAHPSVAPIEQSLPAKEDDQPTPHRRWQLCVASDFALLSAV